MSLTDVESAKLALLHDLPNIGSRIRTVGRVSGTDSRRSLIWLQDMQSAIVADISTAVGPDDAAFMPRVKDLVMLIADVTVNSLTRLPERDVTLAHVPAGNEYKLLKVLRMWPCEGLDLQLWQEVASRENDD